MKNLTLFALALALPACGVIGSGNLVKYQCADDEASIPVKARFLDNGDVRIDVNNGRDRRTLKRAIAASGARYASDGIEFWTKGAGATLTTYGASSICTEM